MSALRHDSDLDVFSPEEIHALVRAAASEQDAAIHRNLAHRMSEFCAEGAYGYLFDRPTTVGTEDAPLVVFNTRRVPTTLPPAPLHRPRVRLEMVERRYEQHTRRLAEGRPIAGPSAVVVEELWKLVERRATGAWVNELVKRARPRTDRLQHRRDGGRSIYGSIRRARPPRRPCLARKEQNLRFM